jgi:hypothetical protein
MANPLIPQQSNQRPSKEAFDQFKQDPTAYLVKCGLQIPEGFSGDYRALVEHLNATGQIPPALRGRVQAMLNSK